MGYKEYQKAAEKGPLAIAVRLILLLAAIMVVGGILFGAIGFVGGWFNEGAEVLQEEAGPRAMLWKYETFVEKAHQIEQAKTNVELMKSRLEEINIQYADTYGEDRTKWNMVASSLFMDEKKDARDDVTSARLVANDLIEYYMQQSSKFNWEPFISREGCPDEKYLRYETGGDVEN